MARRKLTDDERRAAPLIAMDDLCLLGISYSRQHIHRLIKTGRFPTPVRLSGGGRICWHRADLEKYIADLKPVKRAS
jgi:predicted DNA-binding transcriptional regulator AlpA